MLNGEEGIWKILFQGNSLAYEATVLMHNPILHLFSRCLLTHLISTQMCSQADG